MALSDNWLSSNVHLMVGNCVFELSNFCGSDRKNETSCKSEISVINESSSSKDGSLPYDKVRTLFQGKSDEIVSDCCSYELAEIMSEMCLEKDMLSPISPLPPSPPPDNACSLDAFFDQYACNDHETQVISQELNSYCEGVIFNDMCDEDIQNADEHSSDVCEECVPFLSDKMLNEPPKLILSAFDDSMDPSAYSSGLAGCSQQSIVHSKRTVDSVQGEGEITFNMLDKQEDLFSATLVYDDETQTSSLCIKSIDNVALFFEVRDDGTVHFHYPDTKHKTSHSISAWEKLDQLYENSFSDSVSFVDSGIYSDESTDDSQQLIPHLETTQRSSHGEIKTVSCVHKKYSKLFVAKLDYDSEMQTSSLSIESVNKVPVCFEALDDGTLHFRWSDPQCNESSNNSFYDAASSSETRRKGSKRNSVLKCTVSPGDSVKLNKLPLNVKQSVANESVLAVEPSICKVLHSSLKNLNNKTSKTKTSECSKQCNEDSLISTKLDDNIQSPKQHCVDMGQVVTQVRQNSYNVQQSSEQIFNADNEAFSCHKSLNAVNNYSEIPEFCTDVFKTTSKQNVLQDDQEFHKRPVVSTVNSVVPNSGHSMLKVGMQVLEHNEESNRPESALCESDMSMQYERFPTAESLQIITHKTSNSDEQQSVEQPLVTENRSLFVDEQLSKQITDFSDVHETNIAFSEQNKLQEDVHFQNLGGSIMDSVLSSVERYCLKGKRQIPECNGKDNGKSLISVDENLQSENPFCVQVASHKTSNICNRQQTPLQLVPSGNISPGTSVTKNPSHAADCSCDVCKKDCMSVDLNMQQYQNLPLHSSVMQTMEYNTKDNGNKSVSCEISKNMHPEKLLYINSSQIKSHETSNVAEHQLSACEAQSPSEVAEFSGDGYETNPILSEKNVQKNGQCFQNPTEISTDSPSMQSHECYTLKDEMKASECNKQDSEKNFSWKSKDLRSEQTCGMDSLQTRSQEIYNLCNEKESLGDLLNPDSESLAQQDNNTKLLAQKSSEKMLSENSGMAYPLQPMSEKTYNLFDHNQSSEKPYLKNNSSFVESKKRSATEFEDGECSVVMNERKKKRMCNEEKYKQCSEILSQGLKQKVQCDKQNSSNSSQLTDELHHQHLSGHILDVKAVSSFSENKNNDIAEQKSEVIAECGASVAEISSAVMKQHMHWNKQYKVDTYPSSSKVKPLNGENCHENHHSNSVDDEIFCENPMKKQKCDEYKLCNEKWNGTSLLPEKRSNGQYKMSSCRQSLQLMYEEMWSSEQPCIVKPGSSGDGVEGKGIMERLCKMTKKKCVPKSDAVLQKNSDHSTVSNVILPSSMMESKNSAATGVKKRGNSGINFYENVIASSSSSNFSCEEVNIQNLNVNEHKVNFTNLQTSQEVSILSPCRVNAMKKTVSAAVSKMGNARTVNDFSMSSDRLSTYHKKTANLGNCIKERTSAIEKLNVNVNYSPSGKDASKAVGEKKMVKGSNQIISKHRNSSESNFSDSNRRSEIVFKNLLKKHSSFERSWRKYFFHLVQKKLECNDRLGKCLARLKKVNGTHERFHNVFRNQVICSLLNPAVVSDVQQAVSTIISHFCSSTEDPLRNAVSASGSTNFLLMPLSEQFVVDGLFIAQQKDKPHLRGIIPAILSAILRQVFQSSKLELFGFAALCRLYTAIYKKLDFLPGPQLLCRDILTKCRRAAPYLIASIVGVWPKVLEFQDSNQDVRNPLNLAVPFLLLEPCGGHFQNMAARDFNVLLSLTKLDFHLASSLSAVKLVEKIFEDFTHLDESGSLAEDEATHYVKALELVCERQTWKWVVEIVITEAIYPLLDRWIKRHQTGCNMKNSVAVTAVFYLLGSYDIFFFIFFPKW